MADSSASYIHTVQHLIEKCLLHRLNKEECVEALDKHANIKPVITSTVWAELEKENSEFFVAYAREMEQAAAAMRGAQKLLPEPADRDIDGGGD